MIQLPTTVECWIEMGLFTVIFWGMASSESTAKEKNKSMKIFHMDKHGFFPDFDFGDANDKKDILFDASTNSTRLIVFFKAYS